MKQVAYCLIFGTESISVLGMHSQTDKNIVLTPDVPLFATTTQQLRDFMIERLCIDLLNTRFFQIRRTANTKYLYNTWVIAKRRLTKNDRVANYEKKKWYLKEK